VSELKVEVINKIEQLVEGKEKIIQLDGKNFSRHGYHRVYDDPRPKSLTFSTLGGLADYIKENLDSVEEDNCMIVIDDYDNVSLYSPVQGESNERHMIAEAKLSGVEEFKFGKFLEQEEFIISFSSLFCNMLDKDAVISCVASMTIKAEANAEDNGNSVAKSASNRIETNGKTIGPVLKLAPFRTFRELDQPQSAFIFRYKAFNDKPGVALFEADGGAWKLDARQKIKDYLEDRLDKTPIMC